MSPYAKKSLAFGPSLLEKLIKSLPPEALKEPTGPDRFSPHQVICHLAYWEPVMRGRIEAALAQDSPLVEDWDEEAHAEEHDYHSHDLQEMMETLKREREATCRLVEGITFEQGRRVYVHPVAGRLTIADGLGMIVGHDMYHVAQLIDLALP